MVRTNFNDSGCVRGLPGASDADPGRCNDLFDTAATYKTVGMAGLVGTGLLAVSSAVLFVVF